MDSVLRVCKFFSEGYCKKGNTCEDFHLCFGEKIEDVISPPKKKEKSKKEEKSGSPFRSSSLPPPEKKDSTKKSKAKPNSTLNAPQKNKQSQTNSANKSVNSATHKTNSNNSKKAVAPKKFSTPQKTNSNKFQKIDSPQRGTTPFPERASPSPHKRESSMDKERPPRNRFLCATCKKECYNGSYELVPIVRNSKKQKQISIFFLKKK